LVAEEVLWKLGRVAGGKLNTAERWVGLMPGQFDETMALVRRVAKAMEKEVQGAGEQFYDGDLGATKSVAIRPIRR